MLKITHWSGFVFGLSLKEDFVQTSVDQLHDLCVREAFFLVIFLSFKLLDANYY